jgi:hypothetical protein
MRKITKMRLEEIQQGMIEKLYQETERKRVMDWIFVHIHKARLRGHFQTQFRLIKLEAAFSPRKLDTTWVNDLRELGYKVRPSYATDPANETYHVSWEKPDIIYQRGHLYTRDSYNG